MTFEEALKEMRKGNKVGFEGKVDDFIYRINKDEIEELRSDGEWIPVFLDGWQILSNKWYVR